MSRIFFSLILLFIAAPLHAEFEQDMATVKEMIRQRDDALQKLAQGPGTSASPESTKPAPRRGEMIGAEAGHGDSLARDPFAVTPLMQGGLGQSGSGADDGLRAVLAGIKLRGIVSGRARVALIETGDEVWPMQVNDSFDLPAAAEGTILVVRAIRTDYVEIGTKQRTLKILR